MTTEASASRRRTDRVPSMSPTTREGAEGRRLILTLSCPDRIGIVAAVANLLLANECNIIDSAQFGDAQNQRFFMRVYFAVPGRPGPGGPAARVCAGRRAVRYAMASARCGREAACAHHGVEVRTLPERPAVPLSHRRAADRHPGDRFEPSRLLSARGIPRHSVSSPAGRSVQQGAAGRAAAGTDRGRALRSRGARALHADTCRARCVRA